MPIYAYRCDSCDHEFEQMMKMSDDNPPCPNAPQTPVKEVGSEKVVDLIPGKACGEPTEKLIRAGSFHLKGGGWESDGYAG